MWQSLQSMKLSVLTEQIIPSVDFCGDMFLKVKQLKFTNKKDIHGICEIESFLWDMFY